MLSNRVLSDFFEKSDERQKLSENTLASVEGILNILKACNNYLCLPEYNNTIGGCNCGKS